MSKYAIGNGNVWYFFIEKLLIWLSYTIIQIYYATALYVSFFANEGFRFWHGVVKYIP